MIVGELCIFGFLNKLDIGYSIVPDKMHLRLLKELAHFIANPLWMCFSLFVTQGRLPEDWMNVSVSPILITGTNTNLRNINP